MFLFLKYKPVWVAVFLFIGISACTGPAEIICPKAGADYPGGTEIVFMAVSGGFEGEDLDFVWDFGDGTKGTGENTQHAYDTKGLYVLTLTVTNEFTETCTDTLGLNITSSRFVKLDGSGAELPANAPSREMVLDKKTDLVWEVKQNKDFIEDYANIHDSDNIYTWYDSDPETNGGHAGTDGDGTDTEDFIAELNTEMFGSYDDWRMPECEELASIRDSLRFNPAVNTDYFPETTSGYYWSSTSYEWEYNYSACHIDFMGSHSVLRGNHYGYKRLTYHVRGVRDHN